MNFNSLEEGNITSNLPRMKYLKLFLIFLFLTHCFAAHSQIKYEQKDKEILQQVFEELKTQQDKTTAELVVLAGKFFKETPYVAHTLEVDKEQLVINLHELDCTTYAENCLAIARTVKSKELTFEHFAKELTQIRYRKGIINGYPSRLHYFSDWIYANDKKGLTQDVSKDIGNISYPNTVNFMSTHPASYKQLENNPAFVAKIAQQEKKISSREVFFLPKEKLDKFEDQLKEGDIVGITTSVSGLDITHVGIIVKNSGKVHLMHASSKAEKVAISENTLQEYLLGRKSATGIMVTRPR